MLQFAPLILKFLGLGGVGRRGGIALLAGAVLLLLPVAIPAIKAKIPFIGTEAKLERQVKRNDELLATIASIQTDLGNCLSANEANSSALSELQDQAKANAATLQTERDNRERLRAEYEAAERQRRQHDAEDERKLADAIRQTADQCANTSIPADLLDCLRDSAQSCDAI